MQRAVMRRNVRKCQKITGWQRNWSRRTSQCCIYATTRVSPKCCSSATSHILEYQRVNPFLGGGVRYRKAGEGGKCPLKDARVLKKRRCHNWRLWRHRHWRWQLADESSDDRY